MNGRTFFFAGGGTGGHIYPAVAVAEQITRLEPEAKIHFFVSSREIDAKILSQTDFNFTQLPAKGFSARPAKLIEFVRAFLKSSRIAEEIIAKAKIRQSSVSAGLYRRQFAGRHINSKSPLNS